MDDEVTQKRKRLLLKAAHDYLAAVRWEPERGGPLTKPSDTLMYEARKFTEAMHDIDSTALAELLVDGHQENERALQMLEVARNLARIRKEAIAKLTPNERIALGCEHG